ncbi:MAG: glycosyltransferase [Planctomycetes bacterium]|nr:glycosyltransferase [Planctomycetota bacterium]
MLGWEFPPFISGGLGTACYGLTRAMDAMGLKVSFVLPKVVSGEYTSHVKLLTPDSRPRNMASYTVDELQNVMFHSITSTLQPYKLPEDYQLQEEQSEFVRKHFGRTDTFSDAACNGAHYGQDMYSEVHRYAAVATSLALHESFDLIHAHDWMTYPAGMAAAMATGKPLVVHVHSTEFDRSGEHVNQMIYDIERAGMERADKIIAVSHYTRNIIISRYGVPGDKVEVVHNGVESSGSWALTSTGIDRDEKIVLFLGRITMQKGPEYFLRAAKKVIDVMDHVKFVMAGSGDMMNRTINMAAELGIGNKVLFTGFLRGDEVRQIYQMADLYVMPSVTEPSGIAPLKAMNHDVPVIISKQSGVSEVLTHALKVDFWDVDEIANKIVAVLKYPPLQLTLRNHGNFEVRKLRWEDSAEKCASIYEDMLMAVC